jgi:cytoskeletal protein RodZ
MSSVGEQLRKARLTQSLDLAAIAEQTKISKYYLEAIESDQIERLPGAFFYKAFVRQYSKYLGLDPRKFEAQMTDTVGDESVSVEELRHANFPATARDPLMQAANRQPSDLRFVFAALGLIVVLVGGSLVYTWMQRPVSAPVTSAETRVKPSLPRPSNVEASQQPSNPAASSPEVRPPGDDASLRPGDAALREVVDNLTPNVGPNATISLNIAATEATWLQIESDGKIIYQGMLEPHQAKTLAGQRGAKIKVGNAAGVAVKWNGKSIGPIGERGQVRVLSFTDKEYQIIKTKPKEEPKPGETL